MDMPNKTKHEGITESDTLKSENYIVNGDGWRLGDIDLTQHDTLTIKRNVSALGANGHNDIY